MSTPAQRFANRENAKLSTGPTSEAGKAAVSQNNFRHGLAGAFVVLPMEDESKYESLLTALLEEHQPATATEHILVEKMAQNHWLTQRALSLMETWFSKDRGGETMPALLRYQTTHERAFHKALADLLKLRSERRKAEIGFESLNRKRTQEERLQAEEERRQAEEARRQALELRKEELHKWAVLMAEAEFTHRQVLTLNAKMTQTDVELGKQFRDQARRAA